ncbi:MAG: adenylate/guanylate cyclase domain-containing protein [Pseudomonadota bacterium]|nr:adenylate/guanylate cyclase domain-containing protein [Pseudomonadota bacterium]
MERKLSTIVAMDVVGFSKMMAENEEGTLKLLTERREVIDSVIKDYEGRIFNTAGDSVIAEFSSPVKAAECAVQIQNKNQALNEYDNDQKTMSFRVGINMGDVMVTKDNLYGDTINIAARLEASAVPDGICISKNVYDLISLKIKVSYEDAGELNLKNIGRPIPAFHIVPSKGATRGLRHADEKPVVKIERAESGSLAVMLFKNLSNDEEQEYFCEGFSEDLISALSRYKKLTVVASNASFSYRDKSKMPKEIGSELGVRYLLEGKVRKLGSKIRITASLVSSETENNLWSSNFDKTLEEIFDIQDELVETIVSTIVGNVEKDQINQLSDARPENMEAYDLVLQGLEYHRRSSVSADNNKKALELFTKATEVDPNYARAHAWKCCSLGNNSDWFPEEMPENWMQDAFGSVNRALELDPNDPEAHRIMGAVKLLFEGDMESAIFHHEKAIEICPSDTFHIARYSILLVYLGDPEKGLVEIHRAMRIDPFCSDLMFEAEGLCNFWLSDYAGSVASFKKMKIDTRDSLFYLSAAYQMLTDAKAVDTLNQAKNMSKKTIEEFVKSQPYKSEETKSKLGAILSSIN